MESAPRVDCAGRRRSPATVPGYHRGRPPRNQGLRHPPDPPTVEEIIAVMRAAGDDPDGIRLRGGSSCCGALGCGSAKPWSWARAIWTGPGGAIQVRHGKGGRHHEVGMDRWAWEQLDPGSTCVRGCRSARCSACCAARLADGRAQPLGFVSSCAMPRSQPGCVAGCARSAPACSRCRDVARGHAARRHTAGTRACRPRGVRPCTCAGSTTQRSCTPSTIAPRR
jgi:hypothetical protein